MSKRFIEITSGWIPVSLLLLFTVALVTEQAAANLSNESRAIPQVATPAAVTVVISRDALGKIESVSDIVDTVLALPSNIELRIDARVFPVKDEAGANSNKRGEL